MDKPRGDNRSDSNTTINIGTRSVTRSVISEHIRQLEQDKTHEYYPGTERTRYDFTAERHSKFKMNVFSSIGNMLKTSIGVGILVVPYGFMRGGLWFSLGCSIFFGYLVYINGSMLVRSAHRLYTRDRIATLTYTEMVGLAASKAPWESIKKKAKTIKLLADIFLYCEQIGSCCVFILIIASILQHIVRNKVDDLPPTYTNRVFIMIVFLVLCIVCVIRAMRIVVPIALAAELVVFMVVICLFIYGLVHKKLNIPERKYMLTSLDEFVVCTSIILYAQDVIVVVMPAENHVYRPMLFILLLRIATFLIIVWITALGFFGYNYWGEDCEVPITKNLPDNLLSMVIQIAVMVSLCITFSTQFWVPYKLMCRCFKKGRAVTCKSKVYDSFYRLILLLLITVIAITIPNTVEIIVIISSIFLSILTFVFPPFIDTIVTWPEHPGGIRWRVIRNIIIMLFGVLFTCTTFVYYAMKCQNIDKTT